MRALIAETNEALDRGRLSHALGMSLFLMGKRETFLSGLRVICKIPNLDARLAKLPIDHCQYRSPEWIAVFNSNRQKIASDKEYFLAMVSVLKRLKLARNSKSLVNTANKKFPNDAAILYASLGLIDWQTDLESARDILANILTASPSITQTQRSDVLAKQIVLEHNAGQIKKCQELISSNINIRRFSPPLVTVFLTLMMEVTPEVTNKIGQWITKEKIRQADQCALTLVEARLAWRQGYSKSILKSLDSIAPQLDSNDHGSCVEFWALRYHIFNRLQLTLDSNNALGQVKLLAKDRKSLTLNCLYSEKRPHWLM